MTQAEAVCAVVLVVVAVGWWIVPKGAGVWRPPSSGADRFGAARLARGGGGRKRW